MTDYRVIVTREGDNWLADVPAVPGAHTYAKSLTALVEAVKEVIILMDDLPDDANPDLVLNYDVDDEAIQDAAVVGRVRTIANLNEQILQTHTSRAVARLAQAGYSVRDASVLLQLTPGRVSQITQSGQTGEAPPAKDTPFPALVVLGGDPRQVDLGLIATELGLEVADIHRVSGGDVAGADVQACS